MKKLKILILIKPFGRKYPKHKAKYDMIKAIEKVADVRFWSRDGHIRDILKKIDIKPDFILHYEMAWGIFAPKISGLRTVPIPTGCYMIDTHYRPPVRRRYFRQTNVDLIFGPYKAAFYKDFPAYRNRHRWLPFSIDTNVYKDWGQPKDIDFLLLGQVAYKPNLRMTPAGKYPFRDAVYKKMRSIKGFSHKPHPGHLAPASPTLLVNERYAQNINRAKIFFTCGGAVKYPLQKFFEVPGCGALLLAESNSDLIELGFKDGENFVACNRSNFYEKALYYRNNHEERERIARNGYDLVHNCHSNLVRANQFVAYVEELLQNWKGRSALPPVKRKPRRIVRKKRVRSLIPKKRRSVLPKKTIKRRRIVRRKKR